MGHRKILGTSLMRRVLLSSAVSLLLAVGAFRAQEADPGWPRDIVVPQGTITVYQPQAEGLNGNLFFGRAAVSFLKNGGDRLVFGVLWFQARLSVDRDQRNAELTEVVITRVRFPTATPDQERKVGAVVQEAVLRWPAHPISVDKLKAILEVAVKNHASAEGLKHDPPRIIIAEEPSVLVLYDGAPVLRDLPGTQLQRVINTPFPVLFDPASGTYYLTNTTTWFTAKDPLGPWQQGANPPAAVAAAIPPEAANQAKDDTNPLNALSPPRIVTSTEPAELIWTDGKADFRPAGSGGDLQYAQNTDGNLFLSASKKAYYVLLSGRWFTSASLQGPWAFVQPKDLPVSFGTILPSSSKGPVRSSVPGTEESKDALMDTQIPQTAAVSRDAGKDVTATFDGEPQFKPVEGVAGLEWAVNTPEQIMRQGATCYLCKAGVWYTSPAPAGPWTVSDRRPDGVDQIPASNPLYNTRYVQIFNATPEAVFVGYTPGYLGAYPYFGTVVYGTGWHTPGYVGASYSPHAWTYGWGSAWSPYWGWGMGSGFGWGFAWGFAWASGLDHWGWSGGCWGPAGIYNTIRIESFSSGRGALAGTWPGLNAGQAGAQLASVPGGKIPVNNLYNRGKNPGRRASTDQILQSKQQLLSRPKTAREKPNNVFAGSDGQIYRRTAQGQWQRSSAGGWVNLSIEGGTASGQGAGSAGTPDSPLGAQDLTGMRSWQQQALEYEYTARDQDGVQADNRAFTADNYPGHSAGGGGTGAYSGPPKKP
jgi:hypothetical protein